MKLTIEELQVLMPLLGIGAKKMRRKMGELAFTAQYGAALAGALEKLQQMADEGAAPDGNKR